MASTSGETKPKRKRIVLSIAQKIEIIDRLDRGETAQSIMKSFGIGRSTIYDVKCHKEEMLAFVSKMNNEEGSRIRKTMKTAENEKLDEALYLWFNERRTKGKTVSGPALCEKARLLNEELGGSKEFKASYGWLQNFKSRHGILELEVRDPVVADKFGTNFEGWLKTENEPEVQILDVDDEIINLVQEDNNENDETKTTSNEDTGPSHSEAFAAAETLLQWYKNQHESDPTQLLMLKRMRDLAAQKRITNLVQKKVSD